MSLHSSHCLTTEPANGGEALCGIKTAVFTLKWGGWDLNPRPEDYESSALTG